MNPAVILQILQILLVAEPTVVQAVHDLLTGHGGTNDVQILAGDKVVWENVQSAARKQLGLPDPPVVP